MPPYHNDKWTEEEDHLIMTVFLKLGQPHQTKNKFYSWTDAAEEMNEEVARRCSATSGQPKRVYARTMILSHWKQLLRESDKVLEKEGFHLEESEKGYVNSGGGSREVRGGYSSVEARLEEARSLKIKPKEVKSREVQSKKFESKGIESKEAELKGVEIDPWEGLIDTQLLEQ